MSKPMSQDKVLLAAISLLLSVLLWLQVTAQTERPPEREMEVRLEPQNLSPSLMIVNGPSHVTVIMRGSSSDRDRIEPSMIFATVDLSKADPQKPRRFEVKLFASQYRSVEFSLKRPTEYFQVARIMQDERKVEIETTGRQPSELKYDGATADPPIVTIRGPEWQVPKVANVRATLDLSKIRPGKSHEADLQILSSDNKPLPKVSAVPSRVTIWPSIAAAPTTNNFLITPNWQGQPAFGYTVEKYEIRPNQIQLSGQSSILAGITRVETAPINLEGLKSDAVIPVRLLIPRGTKADKEAQAVVHLWIGKAAAPTTEHD